MTGLFRKRSLEARDLSGAELVEFIKQQCKKQSEQAKEITDTLLLKKLHDSNQAQYVKYAKWFRDAKMWHSIAAACGADICTELTTKIGPDIRKGDPQALFLTGLSTLKTRDMVWDIIIDSTAGQIHDHLLETRQFEYEANVQTCQLSSNASIYIRGTSTPEALDVRLGLARHPFYYSFVSITPVLQEAARFASIRRDPHADNRIVMVMDAPVIRKLGSGFAQYSIAAEALRLKRSEESVLRTSRFKFAPEMQVHFDVTWPHKASEALLAIWPIGNLDAQALDEVGRTGVPVISLDDI